jgi:hypothetical protein
VSGGLLVIAMTTRPLHCGISLISAEPKRKTKKQKSREMSGKSKNQRLPTSHL